jgi:nucleoside-diphosphate-sugar epimerase
MADDCKPILRPGTKVAVTGATGFVGGRLVEVLVEQGVHVTCLVRRGAISTRLQQTRANLRVIDLTETQVVCAALGRIDIAFHCAYDRADTGWNYRALSALIAACSANACRLVHVSSWVVYQLPDEGGVTEETAESTYTGRYADTKRKLEHEILRAICEEPLSAAIIQPTLVYGPFLGSFMKDPLDQLRYGTVVLPDRGEGLCNLVYVDDVVSAMILAGLHSAALGQRFLVSGPEPVTWRQFYEEMARAIGANGPQYRPAEIIARENKKVRNLLRVAADPDRVIRRLAQNKWCRKFVEASIAVLPQGIHKSTQDRLFGPSTRRRGQVHIPNLAQLKFMQSRMTINSGKARRELGYAPRFDFAAGMVPTSAYLSNV